MKDLPTRDYLGVQCVHCGSTNTVVEHYLKGDERVCMTCCRPVTHRCDACLVK